MHKLYLVRYHSKACYILLVADDPSWKTVMLVKLWVQQIKGVFLSKVFLDCNFPDKTHKSENYLLCFFL